MLLPSPIYKLKRLARERARLQGIPRHQALDLIAQENGYTTWSLLSHHYNQTLNPMALETRIHAGELILIGARPMQGKTSLCLKLIARALLNQNPCALFSFELSTGQLTEKLSHFGVQPEMSTPHLYFDNSDEICAEHITNKLTNAKPNTLVVIDYMQLLDQRRTNPPIQVQIEQLSLLAAQKQLKMLLISQIDKRFEDSTHTFPTKQDIRLPNPLDVELFDQLCFLHQGRIKLSA